MRLLLKRSRLVLVVVVAVGCVGISAPTVAAADETPQRRPDIRIANDADFTETNGVRGGAGTAEDPYVISGWDVANLTIKDTSSHVMIMGNVIRGRLTLDWIGAGVEVHDNDVHDLRVNQNVPRTGSPTSGLIADNVFTIVGQLRHWDGTFERNVVGVVPNEVDSVVDQVISSRAFNFDGFNGAVIRDNTIYGYMDARLHGHHHSSGFGEDSHHHSTDGEAMDHSVRYHEVWITGNRITAAASAPYALSYLDTAHANNDRTAASEENPALNDPHEHITRVHITDNELVGAGLEINVFNARDELHRTTNTGLVDIARNTVQLVESDVPLFGGGNGITVSDAEDVNLCIIANTVNATNEQPDPTGTFMFGQGAGIALDDVTLGAVHVYDNSVTGRRFGVSASRLPESTQWYVDGLTTNQVDEDVHVGNQVHHPPGARVESVCTPESEAPAPTEPDPHQH